MEPPSWAVGKVPLPTIRQVFSALCLPRSPPHGWSPPTPTAEPKTLELSYSCHSRPWATVESLPSLLVGEISKGRD